MIALAETVARYAIPIDPFEALIDAFVQDQTITEYQTYAQLVDYCKNSANPVGHLVLHVAGAFNEENARLSDLTCTALQLANFWQDVARDLAIGRIYLPREDRERFGYSLDDLRALCFTPAFAALLEFEVTRTRRMFQDGQPLLPKISGRPRRRHRAVLAGRPRDSRPDRSPAVRRLDRPAPRSPSGPRSTFWAGRLLGQGIAWLRRDPALQLAPPFRGIGRPSTAGTNGLESPR